MEIKTIQLIINPITIKNFQPLSVFLLFLMLTVVSAVSADHELIPLTLLTPFVSPQETQEICQELIWQFWSSDLCTPARIFPKRDSLLRTEAKCGVQEGNQASFLKDKCVYPASLHRFISFWDLCRTVEDCWSTCFAGGSQTLHTFVQHLLIPKENAYIMIAQIQRQKQC